MHPLIVAVTLTVAVTGLLVLLVAVNADMFPVPLVPKPTSAVLVQLKVAVPPVVGVLKLIAAPDAPLQ